MNHHDDKIKAQLINELDGMRQRGGGAGEFSDQGRIDRGSTCHQEPSGCSTVDSYGFDEFARVLEDVETTLQEGRDGKRQWTDMDWSRLRDRVDQARAALERETPSD